MQYFQQDYSSVKCTGPEECITEQCILVQCIAVQPSALQYNVVQRIAVHCRAAHGNVVQGSAMQCREVQCSAGNYEERERRLECRLGQRELGRKPELDVRPQTLSNSQISTSFLCRFRILLRTWIFLPPQVSRKCANTVFLSQTASTPTLTDC